MSSDPRVSIVVPAYNAEQTIAETLASLAAQLYANLEVIIVDDGSSDRTAEIARSCAEKRSDLVRYVHQKNSGQAAALNNGWSQATGEFLGYLSADDILYPNAIAELSQFLRSNDSVAAVYPDYDLIDANSKIIRRVDTPDFSAIDLVEHSLCQPGPGALFRKDAFQKTGGWNRELRLTPDFDFWLRLSKAGELRRLAKNLAGFRVHEGSQSFAAPSEQKSEEPPRVIAAFFESLGCGEFRKGRAMAWAYVLSARLHLRAGRWRAAGRHLSAALGQEERIIFHRRFWHLLLSGAIGRLRYRLNHATAKKTDKS